MADIRTVVLCLDGTGSKFGNYLSNVAILNSLLPKDKAKQRTYYQPGIGTYSSSDNSAHEPSFFERMNPRNNRFLDLALATGLKEHILGAYQFLVDHCKLILTL